MKKIQNIRQILSSPLTRDSLLLLALTLLNLATGIVSSRYPENCSLCLIAALTAVGSVLITATVDWRFPKLAKRIVIVFLCVCFCGTLAMSFAAYQLCSLSK